MFFFVFFCLVSVFFLESQSLWLYIHAAFIFVAYSAELMRSRGVRMYAADGGAILSHFDANWTLPSALVVGAEARGLGDDARRGLERGDILGVSVPLDGNVESLNAAVAGAIVLGEAQRQRVVVQRQAFGDEEGVAGATSPGAGLPTSAQ